jgi:perosamine synthetase
MSRHVRAVSVAFGDEEQTAVRRVLASGHVVQGPEVAAFEEEFASVVGGRTCVAVNSGTSALHLALLATGIGPGHEVVVPSFSFAASANSVVMAGATPVFADIEPSAFGLDPAAVRAAIGPRTSAIMAVHLYGHPAPVAALRALADEYRLVLIEDAAQAHASAVDDVPAGAWGDVAAFSFYATKNLTTGEGGMVVTADSEIARRARLLRNQGMERQYHNEIAGLNNRMTDIAAALGRVRLPLLAFGNARRRAVAEAYDRGLAGVVATPPVGAGVHHVYHQYTVRTAQRDAVDAAMRARGVETRVYYPVPIHRLPAYGLELDLPETERAAAEVLSLPIHPGLDDDDVEHVVSSLSACLQEIS